VGVLFECTRRGDSHMSEQTEIDLKDNPGFPEKEPELPGADDALSRAKSQLVISVPFLGIITMQCHYAFTDHIPTAAATVVGGKKNMIYWNEDFMMNGLGEKERVFVICHELSHLVLEHIGRQIENAYNQSLWNVATDYCINGYIQEIIDNSSGAKKYIERPKIGLYNEDYKGMSADEIYHLLLDENPGKSAEDIAEEHGGGSGEQDGAGTGDWRDAKSGGKQIAIDEVSKEQQSDASKNENRQTAAASLSQAEQMDAMNHKKRGLGSLGFFRAIKELIEPTIPWSEILSDFVSDTVKTNRTYNRPSRRSSGNIIFPSMDGEHISVCFGVDTSGSMSTTELTEALSELSGIINDFDSWTVNLISCDTDAHHIGDYESGEGDDIKTIDKSLVGGGGTELSPMMKYANEMDDPPNVCIIVSDGYIDDQKLNEEIDEIPLIVVVTSSGRSAEDMEIPKGRILKMDDLPSST